MPVFLVQVRDAGELERARFIPDRFSFAAFVLAPFWLLFHRLWLAFALWVAAEATFILLVLPRVAGVAALAVGVLARLWLGFEAHRLRVAKGRRRSEITDVVEGRDRDGAETAFYGKYGVGGLAEQQASPPGPTLTQGQTRA